MYICKNTTCAISISNAAFPIAMNCPVCQTPLIEKVDTIEISSEDLELINSLPYVIAYPLKETLLQNDYEKRLHRLGYTFINFLKYLGLISISEFFNSDFKNRRIVDLFLSQLSEPSFGKWNGFIRECYTALQKEKIELIFPEFFDFYFQIENKDKKFNISEEIIEDFGEVNYSKKNGLSSIGMLVNFRNKYLGHGTPINENKAKELWAFYYPIFQTLLVKLSKLPESSLYKRENGIVWKLASSVVSEEKYLNQKIDDDKVWLANKTGRKLSMVPFFIIPSDFGALKNEAQLLVYESYTGSTIKFFSPESIVKETSGEILQRLNLLLREKQKETPFTPEAFTKVEFLKRIVEENKLLLETLIKEKKIIPGIYQHREEMETKLREWIGARASIFFVAAEAGSGKTNLLVEIQKQYTERQLPSLLIRAGRMEKQSLKQQIVYLLNIDLEKGLENYSSIAGTQAEPTFILIDGLNEANNADEIWQEVIELSKLFEPGSLKFVITNRANSKVDMERYIVSDSENDLLYGENKDNEKALFAYTYWLTALNMKEMKGAWENYLAKDKSRFKPLFSFDDIAAFDRALYNQICNPLILRLFLEIYNGKKLPNKGVKHLQVWQDWLKTFNNEEQRFLKLLADEIWLIGKNELLLDDLLKNEKLKPYLTSDIISGPYNRLKNNGWISSYVKELNGYIGFTLEGALLYLLGVKLQERVPRIDTLFIESILDNGSKFQKSAIESFLCEFALQGNLDMITDLISEKQTNLKILVTPILFFLKFNGIDITIERILKNPSLFDISIIEEILVNLKLYDQGNLFSEIVKKLYRICRINRNFYFLKILLDNIEILDFNDQAYIIQHLDNLEGLPSFKKNIIISKFLYQRECFEDASSFLDIEINNILSFEINIQFELIRQRCYCNHKLFSIDRRKGVKFLDESKKLLQSLISLLKKHNSQEKLSLVYEDLGYTFSLNNNYENALHYYELCKNIRLKIYGSQHSLMADLYNKYAYIEDRTGHDEKAKELYIQAMKIREFTKGESHLYTATNYFHIGQILFKKGDFNNAISYLKKCLDIRKKAYSDEHSDVRKCYFSLYDCYQSIGDIELANSYFEKLGNI